MQGSLPLRNQRFSLGNFLWSAAGFHLLQLCRSLALACQRETYFVAIRDLIEVSQLAQTLQGRFFKKEFSNPPTDPKRPIHLADIDLAVKHQRTITIRGFSQQSMRPNR
jgi:hypothetical protein